MARTLILAAALAIRLLAQSPDREQIRKVVDEIAGITGMQARKAVPVETVTRDGWKRWVDEEIRRTVKPAEIRAEELVLKKFGLIPKDFDLRKATVDLLGEQAAAIYDHRRKRMLFVAGAAEGMMADAVLVHELSHAIADQNFNVSRFLDKSPNTDEAQSARLAVVEGQAMWIMLESQMRKMGQSLFGNRAALDMVIPSMGKVAEETYPVFAHAPRYLRETLVFPYMEGMMFQQAALDKLGKQGFGEVLRNPPLSTQQVIHPEKYFQGIKPVKPPLPAIEARSGYRQLSSGSVGELDFRILLEQYASEKEAKDFAPGWRGGVFDLLERKKDGQLVLRWAAEWESPEAARRFLGLYRRALAGKWTKLEIREESATRLSGMGDDGAFTILTDGARVTAIEGLKPL